MSQSAVDFHSNLAPAWETWYEKKHFFLARKRILCELLDSHDLRGQSWLDAGCGTGPLSRWLASEKTCRVEAVDASESMLKNAPACPGVKFLQADIRFLPFPRNRFDGVLCSSVLEYLDDPSVALREFARVLKNDGLLVFSVPRSGWKLRFGLYVPYWLSKPLGSRRVNPFLKHSKHRYHAEQIRELLSLCGFSTLKMLPFGTVTGCGFKFPGLGASLTMVLAKLVDPAPASLAQADLL